MTEREYPISEIFGPTRQGEGPQAGMRTFFVRLAGCDWDCEWCDTKYAIGPGHHGWVKKMEAIEDILLTLGEKGALPGDWVTVSGGNPALFVDEEFVNMMHDAGLKIAMETQGSRSLRPQINAGIDSLVVSPKPPSSKMHKKFVQEVVVNLLTNAPRVHPLLTTVKFVAFDEVDLEWIVEAKASIERVAEREALLLDHVKWCISAGTPLKIALPDRPEGLAEIDKVRLRVCDGITALWLKTMDDVRFRDIIILGQVHSLVFGQRAGV